MSRAAFPLKFGILGRNIAVSSLWKNLRHFKRLLYLLLPALAYLWVKSSKENKQKGMDFYREKELNVILYFLTQGVRHLTVTKLFKLIFYFDETHIRNTGRQATTFQYRARPWGPVPDELFYEMKTDEGYEMPAEYRPFISIERVQLSNGHTGNYVKAVGRPAFNPAFFSKRELSYLENIVTMFKDTTAEQISDISHSRDGIWNKTVKETGLNSQIDLSHAVSSDRGSRFDPEDVRQKLLEHKSNLQAFRK